MPTSTRSGPCTLPASTAPASASASSGRRASRPPTWTAFRALYGLPPLDLEQVGTPGSNISRDDLIEAVLDVTWSGAVAPGAAVTLSISSGTLVDAITYLVQRNDVSVMSLSVDFIPSKKTQPLIRQSLKLFRQAATGGKTILVASGDFGPLAVSSRSRSEA